MKYMVKIRGENDITKNQGLLSYSTKMRELKECSIDNMIQREKLVPFDFEDHINLKKKWSF